MNNHIAIIPARKNSKGLRFKNRKLFYKTLNFVKKISWIKKIIVTSDDKKIISFAKKENIHYFLRSKKLSLDNTPIKSVMIDVIKKKNFSKKDILWLFYLPILGRRLQFYNSTKRLIEKKNINSICSFFPVKTHPYNVWIYKKKKINRIIKNDIFRRQDLPKMWYHHHLICAFKANKIYELNSELINSKTLPIFLSEKIESNVFEIDSAKDLKNLHGKNFKK